jgi:hypothetical protein
MAITYVREVCGLSRKRDGYVTLMSEPSHASKIKHFFLGRTHFNIFIRKFSYYFFLIRNIQIRRIWTFQNIYDKLLSEYYLCHICFYVLVTAVSNK